jgi:putative oxidoreductase
MNTGMTDDLGKLILRLTLSVLILFHGISKLSHGAGHIGEMVQGIGLPSWATYGVFLGEVLGPILLLIGWYARIGAALIFINMIFAFVLVHRHQLLTLGPQGGWALELQGMYLLTALALVLTGPGRPAVNNR